jgi:homoserine O-acetyltransferase
VQRSAIALDPNWNGGDYYTAEPGHGPHWGLAVARQLAQTTYRTDAVFAERFDRGELDPIDSFDRWQRFDVEGYLDYQGAKLVRRFDANSYVLIAKAMDLHDVGRGRGGVGAALARVRCPTLTISISSDTLYPSAQQELIRDAIAATGTHCEHAELDSPDGHDAFLLAADQVAAAVQPFLADVESPNG